MIRNLKHIIKGFLLGIPLPLARRKLKPFSNRSTIFISAYNGKDLFFKDKGNVRVSTNQEFADYLDKQNEKKVTKNEYNNR